MGYKKNDKSSFEQAELSVLKTLSEQKELNISYTKGNYPVHNLQGKNLFIPEQSLSTLGNYKQIIRGMIDSSAFRLRYHSEKIQQKFKSEQKTVQTIFEACEEVRTDIIGSNQLEGTAKNILAKASYQITSDPKILLDGDNEAPPIETILPLIVRESLTNKKLDYNARIEELMAQWGGLLETKVRKFIPDLKNKIYDQEEFSRAVMNMVKSINMADLDYKENEEKSDNPESKENQSDNNDKNNDEEKEKNLATQSEKNLARKKMDAEYAIEPDEKSKKKEKSDNFEEVGYKPNPHNNLDNSANHYKTYTTKYDQIIRAEELCDHEEIINLRKQLDIKLTKVKNINRKYINLFLRKLFSQQNRTWSYNLEEGLIDSRKLPILLANPCYLEYYKQEKEAENKNTIVTLLLDNSGSMRGRPITVAAISAEILARTLENFGIKVEILGFTTVEWKGGQSRKEWLHNNSPERPGRLNDLRHIIYKSAETPWRKARANLGVMLKEGILKENIDGEAVIWACNRLAMRQQSRRILMVISDGAPVDDSTISSNSALYLDSHLKHVTHTIETRSDIEMVAIGIGHDVSKYYSNAVTIKDVEELGNTMFQELTKLFDKKKAA